MRVYRTLRRSPPQGHERQTGRVSALDILRYSLAEIAVYPFVAARERLALVGLGQRLYRKPRAHRGAIRSAWRFAARARRAFGAGGSINALAKRIWSSATRRSFGRPAGERPRITQQFLKLLQRGGRPFGRRERDAITNLGSPPRSEVIGEIKFAE